MRFRSGVWLSSLLTAACGTQFAENLDVNPQLATVVALPLVDIRADVNRDGVVDLVNLADDDGEESWDARHGAIFLANIDDDMNRCPRSGTDMQLPLCHDASDDVVNGDDDVLDLAPLKIASWSNAPAGTSGRVRVNPGGMTHLFRKTAAGFELFDEATASLSTDDVRAGVELFLEGKDIIRDSAVWNGYVTVSLTVTTPEKEVTDSVKLRVSPVMLFDHLTAPETSYVTRYPNDPDSTTFVGSLRSLLNQTLERAPLVEIAEPDLWTEDFFETGYASMPAPGGKQHVMRVAFRSPGVRQSGPSPLRAAGKIVFTKLRGRDSAGAQAFTLQQDPNAETLNSWGNTETIPPFTVGGESFPMGRILRGSVASFAPDPVMTKLLESQAVQPPIYVDTSWLLVAHVDETISFLKAPTPRGWVLLLNDPTLARSMLQAEADKGNGAVRMFIGKSWYDDNYNPYPATATISQVLANTNVMGESARSAVEVDAQLEILKAATGIREDEIIRVPFLHKSEYGASVAYQPGVVNGYVAGDKDFIAPDPFGPVIGGKDIFKADFEQKLATIGYTVRWIDNWDLYHVNLGEVHCATNAARKIPETKWWEGGR